MNPPRATIIALGLLIFALSPAVLAQVQKIAELDLSIDLPEGFSKATHYTGFEQLETFTTIKINESKQAINTSISELASDDGSQQSHTKVNISGSDGVLVHSTTTISGNPFEQWQLVFGNQFSTITLTASWPTALGQAMGPALKNALLSTRWQPNAEQQLFTGLPFKLKQTQHLHPVKRTNNSIVLIDKSPYDRSKTPVPVLIVSSVENEQAITNTIDFAKQQLQKSRGLSEITIDQEQSFTIASVNAYRIIANAIDDISGTPVVLYQAIAVQGSRYLLIIGVAGQAQAAQFLPQFKQVVDSVSFKQP